MHLRVVVIGQMIPSSKVEALNASRHAGKVLQTSGGRSGGSATGNLGHLVSELAVRIPGKVVLDGDGSVVHWSARIQVHVVAGVPAAEDGGKVPIALAGM